MRAYAEEPGFVEQDLVITLESKEEIAKLYALFNYVPILDALKLDGTVIRKALVEINQGYIEYKNIFENLDKAMVKVT